MVVVLILLDPVDHAFMSPDSRSYFGVFQLDLYLRVFAEDALITEINQAQARISKGVDWYTISETNESSKAVP